MSGFDPNAVPSMGESQARAAGSGRDWRTFRTALLTVALPIASMLLLLAWAVARLGGELS